MMKELMGTLLMCTLVSISCDGDVALMREQDFYSRAFDCVYAEYGKVLAFASSENEDVLMDNLRAWKWDRGDCLHKFETWAAVHSRDTTDSARLRKTLEFLEDLFDDYWSIWDDVFESLDSIRIAGRPEAIHPKRRFPGRDEWTNEELDLLRTRNINSVLDKTGAYLRVLSDSLESKETRESLWRIGWFRYLEWRRFDGWNPVKFR
jgi:hypothetical protein